MRYIPEFGSRFRILKGGKISLVVSALLVGNLMVSEVEAAQDNILPVVTSTPTNTTFKVGNSFSYTPTATDADGDTLSWSVDGTTKPGWLNVNNITSGNFDVVGVAGLSDGAVAYNGLVLDTDNIPYIAYQDNANSYKITVKKLNGTNWETVGVEGFSEGQPYDLSIAIGSDKVPYVAYRDSGLSGKAKVKKFDGTSWVPVGTLGFSSNTAGSIKIALDGDNNPYVVYQDGSNTKATVQKFTNNAWSIVGTAGFSTSAIYGCTIAFDRQNTPYVMYYNNPNKNFTVQKWNNSNWELVGNDNFGTANSTVMMIVFDNNNIPYVGYLPSVGGSSKLTVNKLNNSNWELVGDNAFTSASRFGIAFDSTNNLYATDSGGNVFKFNSNTWEDIGSDYGVNGQIVDPAMAFDSNDNMYIVYGDHSAGISGKATVKKYTSETTFSLNGTPTTGTYNVNLTVTDGTNEVDYSFQITAMADVAPTITSTPITTIANGAEYSYTIKSSDANGDKMIFTAVTIPDRMLTFTQTTRELFTQYDIVKNANNIVALSDGTMYVAGGKLYKIAPDKTVTSLYDNYTFGLSLDAQGNLYTVDTNGLHKVVKINPTTNANEIIYTAVSGTYDEYYGGLIVNNDGSIYVADIGAGTNHQKIIKITNGVKTNFITGFTSLKKIAKDSAGNIFALDGSSLKKYDSSGALIETKTLDNGTYKSLVIDSNDNIYIADGNGNKIISVSKDLSIVRTVSNLSTTYIQNAGPVRTIGIGSDGGLFATDDHHMFKVITDTATLTGMFRVDGVYPVSIKVSDGVNEIFHDFNITVGTVDTTAPTATITLNDSALSVGESATVTITFSENVTGFTVDDLTAQNGTFSNFAQSSSDAKVYTVTFTPTANTTATTNAITLANSYTDSATNTGITATSGNYSVNTVASNTGGDNDNTDNPDDNNTGGGDTTTPTTPVDTTPPTATITLSDSTLTAGENAIVTITFSEEVKGLELSDFTVANGTLSNLAKSTTDAKVYTAIFVPFINKSVNTNGITLKNSYTDMANNTGTASLSANYTINTYPVIDANKEAVSKALQTLVIPTNINWVTSNLTLPSTVTGSTATISWTSSKPTVVGTYGAVTNGGVVTQGSSTDTYVIMTATITSGSVIVKKPFTIFVPKAAATTTEQTKTITEKISIADAVGTTQTATAITDDINVTAWTTNTPSGFTTTIISDKPTIISNAGDVTRSTTTDEVVTLTIRTVDDADATKYTEKTITVVVKKEVENTNTAKLAEAKEILSSDIIANDNLNLNDITKNLTLPTTLGEATVVWTSSNEDVISDTGVITPKGSDVVVTLKATITVGGETIVKEFVVKVPAVGTDTASKLAEAKTITTTFENKDVDTTTNTDKVVSTVTYKKADNSTVDQKVDIKTDIFTSDITTGTSGEVITTIAPKPSTTTPNQIQEIKVVQNPNGTSTNNVTIKDSEGNSKTTSLNFTPTNVNQEYKDDGSVEINIIPDVTTAKKSQILVNPNGTITNTILDDNNVSLVSSTTQIQDASLFVGADGNVTMETVVATTLNNEDTTATITTTSSSTKVESSTKVGEAEVKSSADVTTGTMLSQNITSGGDVEITATNTAGGRSKKIKTTAQATTTHTVTNGELNTTASFDTAGLNITSNIGTDNITTVVDTNETYPAGTTLVDNELFEGVVITNDDGTSQTKFRITNTVTGAQRYVDSTVDAATSLPQGTDSTIKLVDGKLVIENKQTTTSKTTLKIGVANDNN